MHTTSAPAPTAPASLRRRRLHAAFVALLIVCIATTMYASSAYMALDPEDSRVTLREESALHYPLLIFHVLTASIALVLVPWQLWTAGHHNGTHRTMGRVLLFAGMFPGGVTALILAMMHTYGLASQSGFAISATLWTVFGLLGYRAIRQGRYADHREWMIRSFAVIMGTVMLRVQLALLINVMPFLYPAYREDFGALYQDAFHTIAWLSWFPNLLIAEWYLRRTASRNALTKARAEA